MPGSLTRKGDTVSILEPAPTEGAAPAGLLLRLVRDQRVAFLIVGGINTVVGFGWFVLFHRLVGGAVGYMGTLACAHVAAVLCAFVLHRRFVFRVRGHVWLDLARFEVVNLGTLGVNAALLPAFVELGHLPVVPAQAAATAMTVALSFVGHRFFSFRRPRAAAGAAPAPTPEGEG